MKRAIFFFLLLSVVIFCWQDLLGLIVKSAVRFKLKATLAYRDLHVKRGHLVFEDAVLFDVSGGKSSYLLRAERIDVTWEKPFSLVIEMDKTALTLSSDIFKHRRSFPHSSHRITINQGTVDWNDAFLPPATFSWVEDRLDVIWKETENLSLCKTQQGYRIEGKNFPLAFLAPKATGRLDGSIEIALQKNRIENISLHAVGHDLFCDVAPIRYGGTFQLDWSLGKISTFNAATLAMATDRLRLTVDQASLTVEDSSLLSEGKIVTTYQAGVGGKWEIVATTKSGLPLASEGKIFAGELLQAGGTCQFGGAQATLTKDDPQAGLDDHWLLEWKGLGSKEAAILQEFAVFLDPRFRQGEWVHGESSGQIQFNLHGQWQCNRFDIVDFALRYSTPFKIEGECQHVSFQQGQLQMQELRLKTNLPIELQGQGKLDFTKDQGSFEGKIKSRIDESEVRFFYDKAGLFGSIGELLFDGMLDKKGLLIPRFGGKLPSWIKEMNIYHALLSGRITSLKDGFFIHPDGTWGLSGKIENGTLQALEPWFVFGQEQISTRITDFQCELYADADGVDLVAVRGVAALAMRGKAFETEFLAPRIQSEKGNTTFDLRLLEKGWDYLRLTGVKKEAQFQIDPSRSSFLGSRLNVEGTLEDWLLDTTIAWPLLETFLKKKGMPLSFTKAFNGTIKLEGKGKSDTLSISLNGTNCTWHGKPVDVSLIASRQERNWQIHSCQFGQTFVACEIVREADSWRFQKGNMKWKEAVSLDFAGTMTGPFHFNGVIDQLRGDLAKLGVDPSLQGQIEGKGCILFNGQLEADLDLNGINLAWQEYAIENSGSLYVSVNSAGHTFVKGIECKVGKGDLEAHITSDVLEVDWNQLRLHAKKVRSLIPTNLVHNALFDSNREIVIFGSVGFTKDGLDWTCELQEGFLPLFGAVRHVKETSFGSKGNGYFGKGRLFHQSQEAIVGWNLFQDPLNHWTGKISLAEPDNEKPLVIEGSFQKNGKLLIHSMEGKFAGIDASFRSVDLFHLVGSAQINFLHLSEWIPPSVTAFRDLEMGGGYELKGTLSLDPKNISFAGLFCGKEIELFGYQFRTLMGHADLGLDSIRLKHVLVSDQSGSLIIPELRLQGGESPWTIDIPVLTIRDLRPCLLHKEGEEKKPLTPLVVRELEMRDFKGLLDDGTTLRAKGELSFINSFKRGKSVFDLPTHLFGRIVGLDLELLIPVEGQLMFELDKGYFVLTELKDAFSEGRRSQFFLATQENPPRMSLRGDLEIFVRMKQFVLFALTEAFMISIDGKLADPQFRLQKKKSFL